MNLPIEYEKAMKELLGDEFDAYIDSFEEKRLYGLRVNNLKISTEDFLKIAPFNLTPIPWIDNGFFYTEDEKPGKHPYYYAGLYYLQEPSAMTPANRLPVDEGDRILDMCAAPGGKSTELAAKLNDTGLLVSNDISASRAKALLKNIELFGTKNVMVINEDPMKLKDLYPGYFDKILIDAPCSGEGMFRKDNKLIKAWEKNGPEFYGAIQRQIVLYGADMLKPGGYMMYSTCTFSKYEDEETIAHLLKERPQMELVSMQGYEGFAGGFDGYDECVRIFPHKMQGEGHFLALLHKSEEAGETYYSPMEFKKEKLAPELTDFLSMISCDMNPDQIQMVEDRAYLVPALANDYGRLHKLRVGLLLGEVKKNRFEPSQALAMALRREDFAQTINLSAEDERVLKYLKGETLDFIAPDGTALTDLDGNIPKDGWNLVCVDGYPLGWGKLTNDTLKNKYHAGWRWQ
ncbi:MAG: RsmF rRNA methyltransferase first C-terminal domain-containing protein [Lachnospiraceae bacterium]